MLRIPARLAALTIATDAAAVGVTGGDVQTVLAVLGAIATVAFALVAYGRKDGAAAAALKSVQEMMEQHARDDKERFDTLEEKIDGHRVAMETKIVENRRVAERTHQSVQDALAQMIELGTGRRSIARDAP